MRVAKQLSSVGFWVQFKNDFRHETREIRINHILDNKIGENIEKAKKNKYDFSLNYKKEKIFSLKWKKKTNQRDGKRFYEEQNKKEYKTKNNIIIRQGKTSRSDLIIIYYLPFGEVEVVKFENSVGVWCFVVVVLL